MKFYELMKGNELSGFGFEFRCSSKSSPTGYPLSYLKSVCTKRMGKNIFNVNVYGCNV